MSYFSSKVEDMQEPETWRELLRGIISDGHEKQRIADELGISPITLTRWANRESDPRQQNLRLLLKALPQQREMLLELIPKEFDDFTAAAIDDSTKEIPSAFYARVFIARGSTAEALRFWSICNLILQQALGQLDPDRLGMAVNVVRCMPPKDGKIRSLRESVGLGTPPWIGDLEQKAMFLGAESLAGYVVTSCRPNTIQNVEEEQSLIPAQRVEYEKSAAAYPILYSGRIAGCFLVSSTQPNYFLSQSRLSLIQSYADLIALAFAPEEFYDPQCIELRVIPLHDVQRKQFANFRQRVAQAMIKAAQKGQPINNIQAEQLIWQQLEEELLELSASTVE